jgi:ureidoglycolate lyase
VSAPLPLPIVALTAAAFAPFGEVIEPAAAAAVQSINAGTAQRFHDIARIDPGEGGRVLLSIVRARARTLPFELELLERHPLGSQAFVPLDPATRYLVVVAASAEATPRAFIAGHGQGVNFAAGTWHHPLLALDRSCDFLVLDRGGEGDNCDEVRLPRRWRILSQD